MENRKLNPEIEKRLAESIHSVELECGKMSEEEIELARKDAYGEITEEEFFKEVKRIIEGE